MAAMNAYNENINDICFALKSLFSISTNFKAKQKDTYYAPQNNIILDKIDLVYQCSQRMMDSAR